MESKLQTLFHSSSVGPAESFFFLDMDALLLEQPVIDSQTQIWAPNTHGNVFHQNPTLVLWCDFIPLSTYALYIEYLNLDSYHLYMRFPHQRFITFNLLYRFEGRLFLPSLPSSMSIVKKLFLGVTQFTVSLGFTTQMNKLMDKCKNKEL